MALNLIPSDTNVRFTKLAPIGQVLSLLLVIGSVVAVTTLGLNFGIDFRGGVEIEVAPAQGQTFTEDDLTRVRGAVDGLGLGQVNVSTISDLTGGEEFILVSVERQAAQAEEVAPERVAADDPTPQSTAAELAQQSAAAEVQQALREVLGEGIEFRNVSVVGPTVSGELLRAGVTALSIAIGLMLLYIWFRFEWQFSLGAITALVHDVILTVGMFAVTQLDFTLSIIAALLTIIGYSMNDTVVVFDRVRENLRKFKRRPLDEVVDLSINQTLARTIMTSVTTLLALVSLYFLGGEVLRGFSFAMIWGVIIGTYSSIFIASPVLLRTGVKRNWDKVEGAVPATP